MLQSPIARHLAWASRRSVRVGSSRRPSTHVACIRCSSTTTTSSSSSTTSSSIENSSEPDLIAELESRNLVAHLTSRSLRTHLASAPRTVYSGVDPSADSLHVGNLLPLLTLAHFARFDHRPIVLVGGATGSIGDPSGRSSERNALDKQVLERNVDAIRAQLRRFFGNVEEFYRESSDGDLGRGWGGEDERIEERAGEDDEQGVRRLGMGVRMMNNYEWFKGVSLLEFLGSVGRHARLTQMLARDSVASRLSPSAVTSSSEASSSSSNNNSSSSGSSGGGGMSYTEFSYQLLQAFDFSYLHTSHACTVQIGGSDQLGNIAAGIDLIRRTGAPHSLATDPAYGLTLPLLTTSSGEKFGKSAGNAVWLSPHKTSDWAFYQFFLRSADADVGRYLRSLTLLGVDTVHEAMRAHLHAPKERKAQTLLADHMTRLIRGTQSMHRCKRWAQLLFSHTKAQADPVHTAKLALSQLDPAGIADQDGVLARMTRDHVVGVDVTKVVVAAGLVKSRAEAKRLLASGGLYVNNRQLGEPSSSSSTITMREEDLVMAQANRRLCLLRAGKSATKVVLVE